MPRARGFPNPATMQEFEKKRVAGEASWKLLKIKVQQGVMLEGCTS